MSATDRLMQHLQHLLTDPVSDALLTGIAAAIARPLEDIVLIAHGEGTIAAGLALTDPGVAPLDLLPHAAQYTGGRMPNRLPGESDTAYLARARTAVVVPYGMLRGSDDALAIAARTYLTGSRFVRVDEISGGDRFETLVTTRSDETPDSAALLAALNDPALIPEGMRVVITTSDAPLIDQASRQIDAATALINDVVLADVT